MGWEPLLPVSGEHMQLDYVVAGVEENRKKIGSAAMLGFEKPSSLVPRDSCHFHNPTSTNAFWLCMEHLFLSNLQVNSLLSSSTCLQNRASLLCLLRIGNSLGYS